MNRYTVTYTVGGETLTKTIKAADKTTAADYMQRTTIGITEVVSVELKEGE